MANLLWLVRSRSGHPTACWILRFRHHMTCPRDRTSGCFPSDSIFYQLVLCESADPLTVHSYLLHTLHVFVDMRGIISGQSVLLPATHSSECRSSSVDHIMRRHPIHLPQPVSGAQRSPLTCPANRVRWPAPPQRIRCCKLHSHDTGLWCWDPTPQAASDDMPSQRGAGGGRYLFPPKFVPVKVGEHWPVNPYRESMRLTGAPPLPSVCPEYSILV